MNWPSSSIPRRHFGVGFALLAAVVYAVSLVLVTAADAKPDKKPVVKQRDGAELYRINCARCHSERYPTERTDAQWKTIMLHMRNRAQIPVKDAKAILKYLQENN